MIKHGVSHWCITEFMQDDAGARALKEIGIEGIEMPPAADYQRFLDMGFAIPTIVGHGTLAEGLNRRAHHARIVDEIRQNLEIAKKYGIPNLICFTGNRDGLGDDEGAEVTAEGFKQVAPDAEAAGVNLILELLNSRVDHPGYQADHTAFGARVVKMVNSPRVSLLYDIYHMQVMEGDLIRNIRDYIGSISHFHTAGNPGRNNLNDQQEIYYPAVARAIVETGYSGWIGHEFLPQGDVLSALREAVQACTVN